MLSAAVNQLTVQGSRHEKNLTRLRLSGERRRYLLPYAALDFSPGIFFQVAVDGIVLGFMYALIALGYTMVYGVLEFINFAHSEIFILGAFVGAELLLGLEASGALAALHPVVVILLVIFAGMLASGLAAAALERIAY